MKPHTWTAWLAAVVAAAVLVVTIRAQVPVGAGIYYDDGAYLALARSLATGGGYVYSNLPVAVPGVKYPPAYPAVLAAAWRLFGVYPENLAILKALNALFWALAAAGTFSLFARGGVGRRIATAALATYAFVTVPSMSLATVLMAEPLFLLISVGALLFAGLGREASVSQESTLPVDPSRPGAGRALVDQSVGRAALLGLLGSLAFLTRSIGLTLVVALLIPLVLARRWKAAGVMAAVAGTPVFAWLAWQEARSSEVPEVIAGQYGSYGAWLRQGVDGGPLGRAREIAAANWEPFVETLQFVWVPRTSGLALGFVLVVLGVAIAYALPRVWRRNPGLVLFPFAYLAVVSVWPYEPYRFYYVIVPLLTLLAFEGVAEALPRVRADLPAWGIPVGVIAALVFVVNAAVYHGRGHQLRSWATPQAVPAQAYAPLNDWIRENTSQDAVIASALDPFVHWETGRPAVPSWQFLPGDYDGESWKPEALATALDSVISRYEARFVALIRGDNKAARTLAAFAELHPDRARLVLETPGPVAGVIYAVSAAGAPPRKQESDAAETDRAGQPDALPRDAP